MDDKYDFFKWLENEVTPNFIDPYNEYVFQAAHFLIRIKSLRLEKPIPLSDYDTLNIQIFEFPNVKLSDSIRFAQLEINDELSSNIKIDWKIAASFVDPGSDVRFAALKCAKDFNLTKSLIGIYSTVSYLDTDPDTIYDIVAYCYKISDLKFFW